MPTGVGDRPQDPFHVFNYDGLKSTDGLTNQIDCGEPVIVDQNPDPATLEDVCLSAKPQFFTDKDGNFVVLLSCKGGYFADNCAISSDGTGIVSMIADENYQAQIGIVCAFGPNDEKLPAAGRYFWIEIKVPTKKVNNKAKSVKWAYKRSNR